MKVKLSVIKVFLPAIVILGGAAPLRAQTAVAPRLAILAEMQEAANSADLLTAQLSGNGKVQLLERDQIQRVYREQALSTAGGDVLKVGRLLGADGLLLINAVNHPPANATAPPITELTARMIAVKPGVVLAAKTFFFPAPDVGDWASSFASRLDGLLPKLSVLEKDAIPISIVNLRSATQSDEGKAAENQVKSLVIQRFSQEPRVFVLERQRMESLAEEKGLKQDESPFWNGGYLLDGVLDQNGFDKDTIMLDARLTPPKGGAPLTFAVRSARTNLAELVNQLAKKVDDSLKIQSAAPSWNAVEEAQRFLDEARWALRWSVYAEAHAAAESAWALGRQDADCAILRVEANLGEASLHNLDFGGLDSRYGPEFFRKNNPPGIDGNLLIQAEIKRMRTAHTLAMVYNVEDDGDGKELHFVYVDKPPGGLNLAPTMRALEIYYNFCRRLHQGDSNNLMTSSGANKNSGWPWYQAGVDALTEAAKVLREFNFVAAAREPVADQLPELRALARGVAEQISETPSVHDSYFVGNRLVTYDELNHGLDESPNLFRCELEWGCYWEDRPEETIAMYRQLMESPVYAYVHNYLWGRPEDRPRLVGWNEEDQKAIPALWEKFVDELGNSPDVRLQLEAKAFAVVDAQNIKKMGAAFTNYFDSIVANRETLVANRVELFFQGWHADSLIEGSGDVREVSAAKMPLDDLYWSHYRPMLDAMDQEYRNKTIPAARFGSPFEKQVQFLKENKPHKFGEFWQAFFGPAGHSYSPDQAREIQPVLAAYETNLLDKSQNASGMEKAQSMGELNQVRLAEQIVNAVLRPPSPKPLPASQPLSNAAPPRAAPSVAGAALKRSPPLTNEQEIVTNVLTLGSFLAVPTDRLFSTHLTEVEITAHQWVEDKLLLDIACGGSINEFDTNGNWTGGRVTRNSAFAILDPKTKHWDAVGGPEEEVMKENSFYHRSTLWNGQLVTSDYNTIKTYDFRAQTWKTLDISDGTSYELFNVNGRLYAANGRTVMEIVEGGKRTRLLASTRRQPPMSSLDTEDLGTPLLFEGPDRTLRVATSRAVFTWDGGDWRKDFELSGMIGSATTYAEGMWFETAGLDKPERLFRLTAQSVGPDWCVEQKDPRGLMHVYHPHPQLSAGAKPKWNLVTKIPLDHLAVSLRKSDLLMLAEHADYQPVLFGQKAVAKDGCHAELLYFSDETALPQKLFLKFDAPGASPPVSRNFPFGPSSAPPFWLLRAGDYVFFGLQTPDRFINPPTDTDTNSPTPKTGVWLMPFSEFEPAIAAQKQAQVAKDKQAAALAEKARLSLLAKYDRNHNGMIDQDEKEDALDDPDYISSQLDLIETNHNGWLEPEELSYFDANQNKILEPKEQAGIGLAQHVLAQKLLQTFDENGDGMLDSTEFYRLVEAHHRNRAPGVGGGWFSSSDINHDGLIDLGELEAFLQRHLSTELRSLSMRSRGMYFPLFQMDEPPVQSQNSDEVFKEAVEHYWQSPPGRSGRAGFRDRPPFGASSLPLRMPSNAVRTNP